MTGQYSRAGTCQRLRTPYLWMLKACSNYRNWLPQTPKVSWNPRGEFQSQLPQLTRKRKSSCAIYALQSWLAVSGAWLCVLHVLLHGETHTQVPFTEYIWQGRTMTVKSSKNCNRLGRGGLESCECWQAAKEGNNAIGGQDWSTETTRAGQLPGRRWAVELDKLSHKWQEVQEIDLS